VEVRNEDKLAQDALERGPMPGPKDSALLAMDSLLTLFRLFKSEAALAVSSIPQLIALNLALIPIALLTWISFGVLVACGVYEWTGHVAYAAAAFFVLQVALVLLLESRVRRVRTRLTFPESRQGLAMMQASWKERVEHEERR
jgi:hypothetical protein